MSEEMKEVRVKRDSLPDIKFKGEKVAEASSSADRANPGYSGETGRWCELYLYRTVGGKFVASEIGRTSWEYEHDRHRAEVCNDASEVINFFGFGWLAKELYDNANIDAAEEAE